MRAFRNTRYQIGFQIWIAGSFVCRISVQPSRPGGGAGTGTPRTKCFSGYTGFSDMVFF